MTYVLFAGGGTLGPVTPLIAVSRRMREADPDLRIVWAGTDSGPEREIVEGEGIEFFALPVAKLPRYVSLKLFTLPMNFLRARRAARWLLDAYHPRVIVSAGGYTAVPVVREAVFRNTPCLSHQLDYEPGLSNRLIARYSRYVTTSFSYPRSPFKSGIISYQIPTPVRFSMDELPTREAACRYFNFDPNKLVLLVVGGGTGAKRLNEVIANIEPALPKELQIIHLMGKGKNVDIVTDREGYVAYEFLSDQMVTALTAADIVVSRAGVGAISEFAALKKASILVPLPDSPQVANAAVLKDAVVTVDSDKSNWEETLRSVILKLFCNENERKLLGEALHKTFPTDNGEALANFAFSVMV